MSQRIALIGAGPLGLNVAGIVRRLPEYDLVGFVDQGPSPVAGIEVLGDDTVLDELFETGVRHLVVCIGDSERRVLVGQKLQERGFELPAVIHPAADLGLGARISSGSVVFPGVTILPHVDIGQFCVVEAQVFVGHHTRLGVGCLLGARALVGNHVVLGDGVRMGMGASVRSASHVPAGARVSELDSWTS
jgi:UDP-perosamine 4-acetyltransferase